MVVLWWCCGGGGVRVCDWWIQTGEAVTKAGRHKYRRATLYNTINTRPRTGRSLVTTLNIQLTLCVCVCVSHAILIRRPIA